MVPALCFSPLHGLFRKGGGDSYWYTVYVFLFPVKEITLDVVFLCLPRMEGAPFWLELMSLLIPGISAGLGSKSAGSSREGALPTLSPLQIGPNPLKFTSEIWSAANRGLRDGGSSKSADI